MNSQEFAEFSKEIAGRHDETQELIEEVDPAPTDDESTDIEADIFAEAIFLRSFAAFETDLERLFLHYVTGGASLSGATATSYLAISDENQARTLTRA